MAPTDKPTHVAFTVVPRDDGISFTLSWSHREFLKYIGRRAGETEMDWTLLKGMAVTHMRKLIDEMALLSETPLIGTRKVLLRLTDAGRNILALIHDSEA